MKIRRPGDADQRNYNVGPRPPAYKPHSKIEAIIDKKKTPYLTLECEHYTSWDTVEVYSCWQPRGKFWCEVCNKWRLPLKRKRDHALPQEPLF